MKLSQFFLAEWIRYISQNYAVGIGLFLDVVVACTGHGHICPLEAEQDRNFTMVNMFRILDHDPC